MSRVRALSAVGVVLAAIVTSPAALAAPLEVARAIFEESFDAEQRAMVQILLIAGGYTPVVPQEHLTRAGFDAIKAFEADAGLPVTGVLDQKQVDRLVSTTAPMMREWGFRKVAFPGSSAAIWAPMGLGIHFRASASGLHFIDPQGRFEIDLLTYPGMAVRVGYQRTLAEKQAKGWVINYQKYQADEGWFAMSTRSPDGHDHYYRYHQDGSATTGFALEWDNEVENIHGERIADIMSGSLRATFTGATFPDPPPVADAPQVGQAVETRQAARERVVEERRSAGEHEREAADAERRAIEAKEATAKADAERVTREVEEARLEEARRQQAAIAQAEADKKSAAERQMQIALAERQAATAKAAAATAAAEASVASARAEAERLKRVDEAKRAEGLLVDQAAACARKELRNLVKSGEGAEVLATAVMTICGSDVDHVLDAGVEEYKLEHQLGDSGFSETLLRERLRSQSREQVIALAVMAKAGVGSFAPASSN